MQQERPSFFESLIAGAKGIVKGAIVLGAMGLIGGGLIGGLLGGTGIITGGALVAGLAGGVAMGNMGVLVGGIIGAVTGVVQHREAANPDPQDIINVANISFAQGVETGRHKNVSQEACTELHEASSKFRDKLKSEPETCHEMTRH